MNKKCNIINILYLANFHLGEKLLYKNWASGQPGLFGAYEDCALMELGDGGKWHDYACHGVLFNTQNHGWVCEYGKCKASNMNFIKTGSSANNYSKCGVFFIVTSMLKTNNNVEYEMHITRTILLTDWVIQLG